MLTMSQINPTAILQDPSTVPLTKGEDFNNEQEARDKASAAAALKQMDMQREDTKYATEMAQKERFRGEDRHDKAFANMAKDPMNARMYAQQGGIQWTPEMEQLAAQPQKLALTAQAAKMVKQMGITNAQTAQTFASNFVNNNGDLDATIQSISSMQQYKPDMRRTGSGGRGGSSPYKTKIGSVPEGHYQSWGADGQPVINRIEGYTPSDPLKDPSVPYAKRMKLKAMIESGYASPEELNAEIEGLYAPEAIAPNEQPTIDALIADPNTDPLVLQQAMDAEDAKNRVASMDALALEGRAADAPPSAMTGVGNVIKQQGMKGVGDMLKQQFAPDFFKKDAPQMQGVPLPPSEPPTTKFLGMDAASGYGKFQRADGTMFLSDGRD
jgi:hypothetical protein